jgi:hypothetical protein
MLVKDILVAFHAGELYGLNVWQKGKLTKRTSMKGISIHGRIAPILYLRKTYDLVSNSTTSLHSKKRFEVPFLTVKSMERGVQIKLGGCMMTVVTKSIF